jgi:hypothetical protein
VVPSKTTTGLCRPISCSRPRRCPRRNWMSATHSSRTPSMSPSERVSASAASRWQAARSSVIPAAEPANLRVGPSAPAASNRTTSTDSGCLRIPSSGVTRPGRRTGRRTLAALFSGLLGPELHTASVRSRVERSHHTGVVRRPEA